MNIMHTTNYKNTFIEVAEDCPVTIGELPPNTAELPSVANMQYDMIANNPYKYTSDEVIFEVFALRNDILNEEREKARSDFYSKGQACLRSSPLTKRYGWGIHFNDESKIALYGIESEEYQSFLKDTSVKKVKAMRRKKT